MSWSCDEGALCRRLAELVAFDTQNPGGDEGPMVEKLAADLRNLGADAVETFAVAEHHSVYARFGAAPKLLLNAHVDTVPANSGYTAPPHTLVERDGRLYGLGTADTKGAIAAIVDALAARVATGRRPDGVAVLFSGDEERGTRCTRAFLASGRARGLERAVVCEPTGCRVGNRHRGIGAAVASASSPGGHSSRADDLPSPIVMLARAAVALDAMGRRHRGLGPPGFPGLCMNVAAIDGGVAFNVIPTRATLKISLRPAPGADVHAVLAEAEAEARKATAPDPIEWSLELANPAFQTRDLEGFVPLLGVRARSPVDLAFWTEAALFSEAGIDAVVFGPGDIAQAHGADEYVELEQLAAARDAFLQVLG
jgi:acetylornithine deacetylase